MDPRAHRETALAAASLPYTPRAWRYGRLRGLGHPQLAPFLLRLYPLEQAPPLAGTVVHKRHPNLVCTVALPCELGLSWQRLTLKRFGWRNAQHYLLSPLTRSKARKSYRAACHLLAHGLASPLPLGILEERRWGFICFNLYATEALTNYTTVRQYCATLPDGYAGLLEVMQLIADYTRRMHDSGLWHRDLFLANFLLTGPPGARQIHLIDLNRARRLPYMPAILRAIDLARMEWQQWRLQFLTLYCGTRFSPARFLRILHWYGRWRTWRRRVLNLLAPLRRRRRPAPRLYPTSPVPSGQGERDERG